MSNNQCSDQSPDAGSGDEEDARFLLLLPRSGGGVAFAFRDALLRVTHPLTAAGAGADQRIPSSTAGARESTLGSGRLQLVAMVLSVLLVPSPAHVEIRNDDAKKATHSVSNPAD